MALPELGIDRIRAKVDTGARSSALHALSLEVDESAAIAHFAVRPAPDQAPVRVVAPLEDIRAVRSSSGERQDRPLIRTHLRIGDRQWLIDLTLTDRTDMGFELLLGRQAVRTRFAVDPGRSFLWGK